MSGQEARSAASSSPADVVRLYIKAEYPPQPASQAANQAEDALDALEAENVRLREALEQIAYNSDGELRSGRATALIAAKALSERGT